MGDRLPKSAGMRTNMLALSRNAGIFFHEKQVLLCSPPLFSRFWVEMLVFGLEMCFMGCIFCS
jgi:hypothetical protein